MRGKVGRVRCEESTPIDGREHVLPAGPAHPRELLCCIPLHQTWLSWPTPNHFAPGRQRRRRPGWRSTAPAGTKRVGRVTAGFARETGASNCCTRGGINAGGETKAGITQRRTPPNSHTAGTPRAALCWPPLQLACWGLRHARRAVTRLGKPAKAAWKGMAMESRQVRRQAARGLVAAMRCVKMRMFANAQGAAEWNPCKPSPLLKASAWLAACATCEVAAGGARQERGSHDANGWTSSVGAVHALTPLQYCRC